MRDNLLLLDYNFMSSLNVYAWLRILDAAAREVVEMLGVNRPWGIGEGVDSDSASDIVYTVHDLLKAIDLKSA